MALAYSVDNVRFIERSSLGMGHHWEVRRGFVAVGHIKRNSLTHTFEYFAGPQKQLTPAYRARTLEALKAQLVAAAR